MTETDILRLRFKQPKISTPQMRTFYFIVVLSTIIGPICGDMMHMYFWYVFRNMSSFLFLHMACRKSVFFLSAEHN